VTLPHDWSPPFLPLTGGTDPGGGGGGGSGGSVDLSGYLTIEQADDPYVSLTGDTMTGDLGTMQVLFADAMELDNPLRGCVCFQESVMDIRPELGVDAGSVMIEGRSILLTTVASDPMAEGAGVRSRRFELELSDMAGMPMPAGGAVYVLGGMVVDAGEVLKYPVDEFDIAHKRYVDEQVAAGGGGLDIPTADDRYVNVTGDTVTGLLEVADLFAAGLLWAQGSLSVTGVATGGQAPSGPDHLTRKDYVDAQVSTRLTQPAADARYVDVAGDTMTGTLVVPNVNANAGTVSANYLQAGTDVIAGAEVRTGGAIRAGGQVSTTAAVPVNPEDLTRKDYVDARVSAGGSTPLQAWPIGSVFIAIVATNPAVLLGGGVWVAFGAGRMVIGVDATDAAMDAPEKVGGAKTHAITVGELPAHAHDIDHDHPNVTSGANDITHTHSIAHNHATATSAAADVSHTHTINHDHASYSGTTTAAGSHAHTSAANNIPTGLSNGNLARSAGGTATTFPTDTEPAHTHGITVNLPAFSGSSGGHSVNHTHTVDLPSFSGSSGTESVPHYHPVNVDPYVGSSSSIGGGAAMPTLSPFIAVYMWKRTA